MRVPLIAALLLVTTAGCGSGAPDAKAVKKHMTSDQLALGDPIVNSVGMVLVPIPAGEFQMGAADRDGSLEEQYLVKITRPYYLGSCEVTQGQYEKVMGSSPWKSKPLVKEKTDCAASYVTWDDAAEFCRKLSEQENQEYRLPTEAEWEYACRAGTETTWSFGDEHEKLADHAWYDANAYQDGRQYAHRVGRKAPNGWGLYDMHGNVWEWCQDWYARYDGRKKESVDPTGPEKGRHRVWRGGSFASAADNTRSATRLSHGREDCHPEYLAGFRVVREFTAAR